MRAVTLVNWAKCEFCGHWIHLKFCASVKYVDAYSVVKIRVKDSNFQLGKLRVEICQFCFYQTF